LDHHSTPASARRHLRSIYILRDRLGHTSVRMTEEYCAFPTPEEAMIVKGLTATGGAARTEGETSAARAS
jgi:hypothetical protein